MNSSFKKIILMNTLYGLLWGVIFISANTWMSLAKLLKVGYSDLISNRLLVVFCCLEFICFHFLKWQLRIRTFQS